MGLLDSIINMNVESKDDLVRDLHRAADLIHGMRCDEMYKPIQVLAAVIEHFLSYLPEQMSMEDKLVNIKINVHVIARNPEVWICPHILSTPCGLVFWNNQKHCVTAKTYTLNTQSSLEDAQDSWANNKTNILNDAADELATHIRAIVNGGNLFIPYVPIQFVKKVDGQTYQSIISFRTRYAVFKVEQLGDQP